MIREEGDRLHIEGPITMETAAGLLEAGRTLCGGRDAAHAPVVDLSRVTEVDSAALAMVLAWMRAAVAGGCEFRLVGVPNQLRSLARLYDLSDLLPLDGEHA